MHRLTIVTINTRTVTLDFINVIDRYRTIARHFDKSKVDVICFQEVFLYVHFWMLRSQLKSYPFVSFEPSFFGPKGGLAIFSRLPLGDKRFATFSSSKALSLKSFLEMSLKKGILIVGLKDKSIFLVNTHLSAVIDHDHSTSGKYTAILSREIKELHQELSNYQRETVLVAGDFNIVRGTALYAELIAKNKLRDLFANVSGITFHSEFSPKESSPLWIDYIFLYSSCPVPKKCLLMQDFLFPNKVTLASGKKDYISDHIGLEVSLSLNS